MTDPLPLPEELPEDEVEPKPKKLTKRQSEKHAKKWSKETIIGLSIGAGICFAAFFVIIVILVQSGVSVAPKPVVKVSADDLMIEIGQNPASVVKYKGKRLQVTGKLDQVTGNIQGQIFLKFATGDRSAEPHRVSPRCFFARPEQVSHLKPGDTITVEGEIVTNGMVTDMIGCELK